MVHVRMRLLLNNAHVATYNLVTQADTGAALTFMLRFTYTLCSSQSRMQKERHLFPGLLGMPCVCFGRGKFHIKYVFHCN